MKRKPRKAVPPDYEAVLMQEKDNPDIEKIRSVLEIYPENSNDHDANLLHLDAAAFDSLHKDVNEASDADILRVGRAFAELFLSLKKEQHMIVMFHAACGRSLNQISALTGISRNTIYQAITDIKKVAPENISRAMFPTRTIKFPGGELKTKYEGNENA